MSAGSQVRGVRIDDDLWAEMMICIERRNVFSRETPWNISTFLKSAIREKLDKMERSRTSRGRARLNRILNEAAHLESVQEDFLTLPIEDEGATA